MRQTELGHLGANGVHEGRGGHGAHEAGAMLDSLVLQDRLFAPLLEEIADWMAIAPGMRILDAGCGAGGMAVAMALRGADVVAIDPDPAHLEATRQLALERGAGSALDIREGDITALDAEGDSFDLVWCSRVLHHIPDMTLATRELARVTRPGGRVAVREGGFAFRVLPDDLGYGEPWLEDRLGAAGVGRFARPRDLEGSVRYGYGWPRLLLDAGLGSVEARTFTTDSLSPLSADEQAWVTRQWRRWLDSPASADRMAEADRALLEELADPSAPAWAFRRDDLHLRTGHSVYVGTRPPRMD